MSSGIYVVGFLFTPPAAEFVALIEKRRPFWQAGKLNGIGGKVETAEAPADAMRREFKEETGADVEDWVEFCRLRFCGDLIHFFASRACAELKTTTDERVSWYRVEYVALLPTLPNLSWLVPMAARADRTIATVTEISGRADESLPAWPKVE